MSRQHQGIIEVLQLLTRYHQTILRSIFEPLAQDLGETEKLSLSDTDRVEDSFVALFRLETRLGRPTLQLSFEVSGQTQ